MWIRYIYYSFLWWYEGFVLYFSCRITFRKRNNIAGAQTGILHFLPKGLAKLSLRNNRFVRNRYNYSNKLDLTNLIYIDISNTNGDLVSFEHSGFPFCETFNRNINCELNRGRNVGNNDSPTNKDACFGPCWPRHLLELDKNKIIPITCISPSKQDGDEPTFNFMALPPKAKHVFMNNSHLGHSLEWTIFSSNSLLSLILSFNDFYRIVGPTFQSSNFLICQITIARSYLITCLMIWFLSKFLI